MNSILSALFLFILVLRGGGSPTFLLFLELIAGSIVVLTSGFAFFSLIKIKNLECRGLIYLVTGILVSSLFVYFTSASLSISAGYSFLIWSIVVLFYVMIFQSKGFFGTVLIWRDGKADSLVLLCLMAFTLLWCWQIAGSFPTLLTKGFLSTWIDAYYHGAQLVQFSDPKAVGQGDIFLAGERLFSYHRAIYMLPAVIGQAAHLSGLAAVTALLIPIGFLLLGMIIYCLGTQLSGNKLLGILCVICLLVFPDNSWLGLGNGFLGFRYVIQVAPGTAYGLAGCLLSILFYLQWVRDKSINAALLSLFFACSVYFFRAHFFVLFFPSLIAAMLCAVFFGKKYFWHVTGFLFLTGLVLAGVFLAKQSVVIPFLHLVHLDRGETIYTNFYRAIFELNHPALTVLTGIILLIAGILGVWTILYPILLSIKVRRFGWEVIDYFPLIILLFYIGIVLFSPAIYQTPDELQHRPSGLLYAVFVIFSVFYAIKILDQYKGKSFSFYAQFLFIMLVLAGIIWAGLRPNGHRVSILFRGFSLYQDYAKPLNPDLVQAAIFLRDKAVRGEIFLTSQDDTDPTNVDTAVVVSSISGIPSYLGEQTVQSLRAEPSRLAVIRYRDSVVRRSIVDAVTREKAFAKMRANRISWYIALSYPKWDKHAAMSDFKNNSLAIYHVF